MLCRQLPPRAPDAVQRVSGAPLIRGRYTTLLVMLGVGLVLDATMRKFQSHFLNWAEEAGAPSVISRSLSLRSPVPAGVYHRAALRADPLAGTRLQRGSNTFFLLQKSWVLRLRGGRQRYRLRRPLGGIAKS